MKRYSKTDIKTQSPPVNPSVGFVSFYATENGLYQKSASGIETPLFSPEPIFDRAGSLLIDRNGNMLTER